MAPKVKTLMRRPFDLMVVAYMVSHIPTTMLIDSQSWIPRHLFPSWATDALDWHIKVNGDHLVSTNPPWFLSLVACELALQLPFFFVAAYAFIYQKKWIRIPALIYGVHVATTMVPILGDMMMQSPPKLQLAAIYSPYLIIPLAIAMRMALMTDPFPNAKKNKHA